MSKLIHAILGLSGLCALAGCLPEDTILNLAYSPDGQLIAIVSEKQGLRVADPAALEIRSINKNVVDPQGISWTTDSLRLIYSSPAEGTQDIYISTLDGTTTRITGAPSREFSPAVRGNSILYMSTDSGMPQLTSVTLGTSGAPQTLSGAARSVFAPSLSPDGRRMAWFTVDDLCPQIECLDFQTGVISRQTSESDPLALPVFPVAWKQDGSGFAYLRQPVENATEPVSLYDTDSGGRDVPVRAVCVQWHDVRSTAPDEVMLERPAGLSNPVFTPEGELLFNEGRSLWVRRANGAVMPVPGDLRAGKSIAGGDDGEIAFVAVNQLIGLTSPTLDSSRYLTFELPDKFLLAEEYYRLGSEGKSYDLYEELASSVQRTRDPEMAKFVYIANLRRLGHVQKAVNETEKLLREKTLTDRVPPELLWRLLGFSYLLEMDDLPQAKASLKHYDELTSASRGKEPDSAENALEIICHGDDALTRLYATAVKARLKGDFYETDRLFGELLTSAPQVAAVQREYLNALNGFDREVYFFSPSQRPFRPTRFQQAEYLERLVRLAPDSDFMQTVRLDLFVLRIEQGSYSRARQLLRDALTSAPVEGRPEGLLEVFSNYLETPEPQPWINHAMPEVFLHMEIRPLLEAVTREPADRFLMGVAATKMALLANDPEKARKEADGALGEWNRIAPAERDSTMYERYGRLLVMRAREAELRGLYGEAIEEYRRALQMMEDRQLVNCEYQEEIRYRASLLGALLSDYPDALGRLREMELRSGVELVNPNWESDSLSALARDQVRAARETSSTQQQWLTYEAGVVFGKMKLNARARAAFTAAASHGTADFIMRKAILELASLDDLEGDAWNSARNYARLASLPDSDPYLRAWCSYNIARLHIPINYKAAEAREALAFIMTAWPDTPLATQAQELLLSTSTR